MPAQPLCSAMCNALKACGSIALGSLIVAIIQFVRIFLEYIDRKTKSLQEDSPLIKYIICCLKCCMWCLEKVMKFLNRNAYIMVAVKGKGRLAGRCSQMLAGLALSRPPGVVWR